MARKISSLKESGISVPEVHGLKSSYIKSKQFSLGNWIHFDDYVVRELKKNLIDTIHIYDEYSFSKLIELRKNIESDELKECDKYVNMICHNDKITKIAAEFGVELKKDTSFQKWMDSYFDKYPILKILTSHDISGHPQKIAPYIEGVVR
jgi:hypothetical protein